MDSKNSFSKIILASASPRRVALLHMLGIEFEAKPSHVDENVPPSMEAGVAVLEIAKRKASHILKSTVETDAIVIGADTTVVLNQEMLGKPETAEGAVDMLSTLSGTRHLVMTGVVLMYRNENGGEEINSGVEISTVKFRDLMEREIRAYVETGEPMDKAGAYGLQGLGSAFVEKIEGCYTNIIGLPVPMTVKLLRDVGVSVLNCP